MRKVESWNPSRVKLTTYQIDTCPYLVWRSALLGLDKDWPTPCPDNVTVWTLAPGVSGLVSQWDCIKKSHECALSQVRTRSDMFLDVARM